MNLQGIVAVSGKGGLYKALGQNKSGIILEAMDATKVKLIANATSRIAAIQDITIFSTLEEDIKLVDIFNRFIASGKVPAANEDGKALRAFFVAVVPEHDIERVYSSDIKKIVQWYHTLNALELLKTVPAEIEATTEEKPAKAKKATAKTTNTADAEIVVETEEKPKAKVAKKKTAEA